MTNTQTDKATKRPWRSEKGIIYSNKLKGKHAENFVGQAIANDYDAELIVKAVNNFDALVKALEDYLSDDYCVCDEMDIECRFCEYGKVLANVKNA